MQTKDPKPDAESGNDPTIEMQQKENEIDPGNEHNHLRNDLDESGMKADSESIEKNDASKAE